MSPSGYFFGNFIQIYFLAAKKHLRHFVRFIVCLIVIIVTDGQYNETHNPPVTAVMQCNAAICRHTSATVCYISSPSNLERYSRTYPIIHITVQLVNYPNPKWSTLQYVSKDIFHNDFVCVNCYFNCNISV